MIYIIEQIEVLSPVNGDVRASISNVIDAGIGCEDDAFVGLHLFKKQRSEWPSKCLRKKCVVGKFTKFCLPINLDSYIHQSMGLLGLVVLLVIHQRESQMFIK